ncbi:uncharacterized protein C9orf85 homolog [Battus philenor]|uniref:uncharacterized protein C9orf85 homolog n=1 Tax=Battus philenor TaxID=42288 RepID=UPI0035D04FEC
MSCSRGNTNRTRGQKHQNRTAFKNDLHDSSRKTKFLNSLDVTGVCARCKEIIEWKIKYKKYKPLDAPRKCVGCEQKTVKFAYHVLCVNCASVKKVCAKCCKDNKEIEMEAKENVNQDKIKLMLKTLPERKRRTLLRFLKKEETVNGDTSLRIEDLLLKMDNMNMDDDSLSLSSFEENVSIDDKNQ